jgi:hypothetical protein
MLWRSRFYCHQMLHVATLEHFHNKVIAHYNQVQKCKSVGWHKMILELKELYNNAIGYGLWTASTKSKAAEAAASNDEVILKAMKAATASIHALQQKVDSCNAGRSPNKNNNNGAAPGTPGNRPRGPHRTPPGLGDPTMKIVDGVLNEWCPKCQFRTSGVKQHNGDTHISCLCGERNAAPPTSIATW